MKKAFLVEYCVRTRVVVDVPDEYNPMSDKPMTKNMEASVDDIIIAKADEKILSDPSGYIYGENVTYIEEDTEMPYDKEYDG